FPFRMKFLAQKGKHGNTHHARNARQGQGRARRIKGLMHKYAWIRARAEAGDLALWIDRVERGHRAFPHYPKLQCKSEFRPSARALGRADGSKDAPVGSRQYSHIPMRSDA